MGETTRLIACVSALMISTLGGTVELCAAENSERESSRHWSFEPVRRPAIRAKGQTFDTNGAIDVVVHGRLANVGTVPSPVAEQTALIRRVTLDLIGLPPSLRDVDDFVASDAPDAIDRVVDRLLSSPHYGEKWARPWLDLCHYADTDGYLTDQLRPVAWRYRAWLVDALNRNMPFDRFTVEQLAGDLLPDATMDQRIATGFLRQTLSNREGGADPEEFRVKQIVDRAEMVGTIWLGLTVGCARCHDHKYDPISQNEFFGLYACFNNADEVNVDAPLPSEAEAFHASRVEYRRRRRELIDPIRSDAETLQKRWESKCLHAWKNPGRDHVWDRQWELLGLVWGGHLGEGQLEGWEIAKLDWSQRTDRQRNDLLDYFLNHGSIVDPDEFKRLKLGQLQQSLNKLKSEFPTATRAPVMQAAYTRRDNYVHVAGEFRDRGPDVGPSVPEVLPRWNTDGMNERLALARWLVGPDNPLTARVAVNRMWHEFFGRGLVLTAEDFGTRGERPSHPRLLDWLASEFVDGGWDVKRMHRQIVASATYRQSSRPRPELQAVDPNNVLLARQNSLRVSGETVRDMGLSVSGLLYTAMGGPSVKPPQPERVTMEAFGYNDWKPSPAPDRYRRGVYTFVIRTAPFAQFVTFDAPNPNRICTRRVRSNTPLQALTLMNDPVFVEMAQCLANRILQEAPQGDSDRIDYGFRLCVSRFPSTRERTRLLDYLREVSEHYERDGELAGQLAGDHTEAIDEPDVFAAWTSMASVLLNLHEFVTRD